MNDMRNRITAAVFAIAVAIVALGSNGTYSLQHLQGATTDGTATVTGFSINGTVNVLAYGAKCDGTTDDSAAFRNAITALGSQGGTVQAPACSLSYVWASEVHFPRNVILQGRGTDASTIKCTQNVGTTACAVWSDASGVSVYHQGGARDITFTGPGAGTTTTGVFTGGDPAGVFSTSTDYGDFLKFYNVKVQAFGTGYSFGNNSWDVSWLTSHLVGNGINYKTAASTVTNAGENMSFVNSNLDNATVHGIDLENLGASIDNIFVNSSIDFNAAPAVMGANAKATFKNCHFEQGTGDIFDFSTSGTVDVLVSGGGWLLDAGTGTDPEMAKIGGNGSVLTRFIVRDIYANASHAVTNLVTNTTTGSAVVSLQDILANANVAAIPFQSPLRPEFALSATGTFGSFAANDSVVLTIAANNGHFTNLTCVNVTGGTCTTAPTVQVFDNGNAGTTLTCSTTQQAVSTHSSQAETLTFHAGDSIGVYITSVGSGCTTSIFAVSAEATEP